MTISYSIDHLSTSVEDVSIEIAAKSEMTLQSTTTDPKTGEIASTYVLASGDNAYPSSVVFRSSIQNRTNGAIRRMSMTFSTWATKSDDVTNVVVKRPVVATFSVNVPSDITVEVADLDDLIGNAFSFLYLSVTSKVRNTTWLQDLLYGIPQVK